MPIATGTFEVKPGSEEPYHEAAGDVRLTHANGTQRFSGGVEGAGSIEWLMCYLPSGGARLVGMQRIEGAVDGRKGTFMMDAAGDHDGKSSTAKWHVVEGSGTGELAGISGQGGFEARSGTTVSYRLDYAISSPTTR
ncbi:MAG: DUF3224 domain-containing protein [Chloroflexota bacterium]